MNKLQDDIIKDCISSNVRNLNSIFVFPTQICASMWADKTLEFSGTTCVALERYIAWDQFKGSAIRSQHQDKNSIPSTMRSVFAEKIVLQNANEHFLKYIISAEYAESADRFSTWIAALLPSLSMWKNNFDRQKIQPDDEDEDLLEIYNRYKTFLDENNLFDPAWETPPFNPDGKKYFIFFPEILMDYTEYKNILEDSDDIEMIHIPEDFKNEDNAPEGHFYSNTRIELKDLVHYLWKIHDEENIPWNKIAVSVPDMDSYGPYLDRELDLYEIPHVQKSGRPLSSNGAGILFAQMNACYGDKFSFDSVKNLLLNKDLPWKDQAANDMLILFGRENNCLCSYEYNGVSVDVWQESFKHPVDSSSVERILPLYKDLKFLITKIIESKTFSEIRTNYFLFREKFFDFSIEGYPLENDKILSRCISELGSLIDLEDKFRGSGIFELSSCYSFFCSYLSDKMYVPQQVSNGVQILPYRTAACAPFDVHVVVDSSQNSLAVVYKQLSFLRDDKRKRLGFTDDSNITQNFILLYAMNAQKDVLFTSSEKTIDAYAFTNSYLKELDHRPGKEFEKNIFAESDSYNMERKSYLDNNPDKFPDKIFKFEKNGFNRWSNLKPAVSSASAKGKLKFDETVNAQAYIEDKVKVSVSDLRAFYSCPRSFLYNRYLGVKQTDNAATLINQYAMGDLNHLILEIFFKELFKKDLPLKYDSENCCIPDEYKKMLLDAVKSAVDKSNNSHLSKQLFLTTKSAIDTVIINSVTEFSMQFNEYKIFQIEEKYELEPEDKDCHFKAIIDCLLSSPDGELFLIDFKNTNSAVPDNIFWDGTEADVPNFQLPVYKYVVENQIHNSKKISACAFYSIRDAKLKVVYSEIEGFDVKDNVNSDFAATQIRCLSLVDEYVSYIREHNFSPSALQIEYSDCNKCIYKSVCRKSFTVSPKQD